MALAWVRLGADEKEISGRICIEKMKINLSQVFAGQKLGLKEASDGTWLVSFMDYDLGYFDTDSCRFEPLANPFGPKMLPMSPGWTNFATTKFYLMADYATIEFTASLNLSGVM